LHNDKLHNLYSSPEILGWSSQRRCDGRKDDKCIQNFGRKIWREETTWDTETYILKK